MDGSNGRGRGARVGVLGASGFTGGELVRLLGGHPDVELTFLGAHGSAGRKLGSVHPHLGGAAGQRVLRVIEPDPVAGSCDIVCCAMPHGSSATLAPELLDRGVRVIDLAGDFRLPASAYPDWYGFEHPSPMWVGKAAYGLPELFADEIAGADLVANPGCFPTAAILGLAPLLSAGLVEAAPVIVDGKTGLSGAGRGPTEASSFAATEESIRPYRVPGHQHTPEIERGLELASGFAVAVSFVPHLVPTVRGVVTTAYARLAPGVTTEILAACLAAAYADRPFVRVLPSGSMADSKRVRASNVLELQPVADPRTGTAIVVGAIDNLMKGAAGQAIQNLNLMLGLDETIALPVQGVYP
jgi:N-acetyl-gamma-glutamyl-phosphate reductase